MNQIKISILPSGSFISLLTILFIGLKLTGYITWTWLWVLSPIWISVIISLIILLIFIIGIIVMHRR